MSENKLVYIASPYAGEVEKNIEFAKTACRYAMEQNCTPIAVHLLYPQFMDDNNPAERKLGMSFGNALMDRCSGVWVCGDRLSSGMEAEFDRASEKNMTIKFLTKENEECSNG